MSERLRLPIDKVFQGKLKENNVCEIGIAFIQATDCLTSAFGMILRPPTTGNLESQKAEVS